MNKPKNQNSILVLATFGVYLGLVLVGATPQVLAQAATAKQFNVKDEIEVKDNLDKKPDRTDEEFETAASLYLRDLTKLLSGVGERSSNVGAEVTLRTFNSRRVSHAPCPADGSSIFRSVGGGIDD